MKLDLRGQKDLGQIVGIAYRVYVSRFAPFFLIALLTVPLPMLSAVLAERIGDGDTESLLQIPIRMGEVVVFLVVGGAIVHAVNLMASGNTLEAGAAIDAGIERFVALLTTQLLFVLLVAASVVAFPYTAVRYLRHMQGTDRLSPLTAIGTLVGMFLFFWVRWNFTVQEVMLAGTRNWSALDGSALVVHGSWWRTLGVILSIVIVAVVPASFIASTGAFFSPIISAIIVSATTAIILPFVIIAQTLLYFDLKARNETNVSAA